MQKNPPIPVNIRRKLDNLNTRRTRKVEHPKHRNLKVGWNFELLPPEKNSKGVFHPARGLITIVIDHHESDYMAKIIFPCDVLRRTCFAHYDQGVQKGYVKEGRALVLDSEDPLNLTFTDPADDTLATLRAILKQVEKACKRALSGSLRIPSSVAGIERITPEKLGIKEKWYHAELVHIQSLPEETPHPSTSPD